MKQSNADFGRSLEERCRRFSFQIIQLSASIEKGIETNVIKYQITKSATSIGANYREANRARSNADFLNKIKICESEANETLYWLELIVDLNWSINSTEEIYKEGKSLLAIFTSIAHKMKQKLKST